MASAVYPNLLVNALKGDTPLDSGDVKCLLYDTADGAYDPSDNDVADLTGAGIAGARSAAMGNKTFTIVDTHIFQFDGDNVVLSAVPAGDECERAIFYYDPGTGDENCLLISDNALTSAITPNGGDITVSINASGVLRVDCTPA